MRKFLFLQFVFAVFVSIAQTPITITSSNMPSSGDTIRYSTASAQGINFSLTGPNVFWNYDTLQPVSQDVYRYKASYLTPYAFYFLGLNQYGLKIADTLGFGTFQFLDVYSFFKKTNASFSAEGTGFKYQGIPLASQYSDNDEIFSFPLNFGDHDSTTYAVTTALGATVSYAQKGYRINDVDGWGVIKTPFDSVQCLRVVSTAYGADSINFNGFGFSFPNVQRSYKWLSLTEKIPILEVSGQLFNGNFTPNQVRYRDNLHIFSSVHEASVNDNLIQFFPNPTNDAIYVRNNTRAKFQIGLYNMNGSLVMKTELNELLNEIKLTSLAPGIYQAVIWDQYDQKIHIKKIVVE